MTLTQNEPRALRLALREWLFLGLAILGWAGFVVFLGKDTSWDFRNYHWYIPYAYLNGRMGFDIAVAHLATYYNPLLDVPFYWIATHSPSWFALAALGAVQGANVVPLYLMARTILRVSEFRLSAATVALLGQTGALGLNLFGTHYYDNVMSVFVLMSLTIVVVRYEVLRSGPLPRVALLAGGAGFLTGASVGLKLPEAPFALGFAAALLAVGGSPKHQGTRLVAGGLGGVLGFLACAGFWMLRMDAMTGNPLFPYFNQVFHSSWALAENYRDLRFVPTQLWREILFPILFSIDWSVADDIPFRDMRVGLAYVSVIVALIVWAAGKRSKDPLVAPHYAGVLFAFAAASYVMWLRTFAIYRYILLLEMLAPLLIVAAVGLLPLGRRAQAITLAVLFTAVLVVQQPDYFERAPLGDPYVSVALPKIAHPGDSMILMTGDDPLGFLAPSLPPQIPILRIDGWMLQPKDGTGLTREMRTRVAAYKGDLYLIADANGMGRAHEALADYGLAIDWLRCRVFDTNLAGAYEFCPLVRH
jgi:hypothetical protein